MKKNEARHIARLVWVENKSARATAMLAEHTDLDIVKAHRFITHDAPSEEALYQKLCDAYVEKPDERLHRLILERQRIEEEIIDASDEMSALAGTPATVLYIKELLNPLTHMQAQELQGKWYEQRDAARIKELLALIQRTIAGLNNDSGDEGTGDWLLSEIITSFPDLVKEKI